MSYISYNSEELVRLFSNWDTIMSMWNDKKSHSINDVEFQNIHQLCQKLIEMSEEIHMQVQQIETESDEIY